MKKTVLSILLGIPLGLMAQNSNYTKISLTGFNQDVVANQTSSATSTSVAFDGTSQGAVFYESGYWYDGAVNEFSGGLPADRKVVSNVTSTEYLLQNFSDNNVLQITAGQSDTLFLDTPEKFEKISFLTSSSQGASDVYVKFLFEDNSYSSNYTFGIQDWFDSQNAAISGNGFVPRGGDLAEGDGIPNLFDRVVTLNNEDASKKIVRIIVTNISAGQTYAGIFAASGAINLKSYTTLNINACEKYTFGNEDLLSSGSYTKTFTNTANADSIVTLNLNLNFAPIAPFIAQQNSLCDSGSFMLNAIPGYLKIQCRECGDNNNYVWFDAAKDSVYNDADFQTPILKYSTTYSVVAKNECGISDTTKVPLEIIKVTLPELQSVSACNGNSVKIDVYSMVFNDSRIKNARIASEFVWYNSNNDSLATTNIYETGILTDNEDYYVKMKRNGCSSEKQLIEVIVNDVPNFVLQPKDINACVGDSLFIKSNATGGQLEYFSNLSLDGVNIVSKGDAQNTGNISDFIESTQLSGIYVAMTAENNCGIDTSNFILYTVNSVDTSVTLNGIELSANNTEAISFQWLDIDNNVEIDGATNRTFIPQQSGNYAVIVSGTTCSDTSGVYYVDITLTSLEKLSASSFSISPNPASSIVNITSAVATEGTISVLDLNGNVLLNVAIKNRSNQLDISSLPNGIYVIKLISDKGVAIKQFVKE